MRGVDRIKKILDLIEKRGHMNTLIFWGCIIPQTYCNITQKGFWLIAIYKVNIHNMRIWLSVSYTVVVMKEKNQKIWQTTLDLDSQWRSFLILIGLLLNYKCLFRKKKQEWSNSIYLKGDACISGFFFFREPGNWGKLWEWWKFNPFKKRCLVYFWIILFARLWRELGNWGKVWEWSKFNLFKGDALCISGFFFVCWLSEGIDQTFGTIGPDQCIW